MARGDLADDEWIMVEPFPPVGGRGPYDPEAVRRQFTAVLWRLRTGSPWRDVPEHYGSWSTVYGRFEQWAKAGLALMDGMITEAAARGQVDLSLVSVDSTVARAHHHAAGMRFDPELLDELAKAVERKRGPSNRTKRPDSPGR